MIPVLIRRCPDCSHVGASRRFATVYGTDGSRLVECPACGHRFRPVDDPRLN